MFKPARVIVSVISYHTEIPEKVNGLLNPLIPEEMKDDLEIQVTLMRGQYRDRIRMHTLEVSRKRELRPFLTHLIRKIQPDSLQKLNDSLEEHLDEKGNTLYFRLDKFAAADGVYRMASGSDVIKVEIKYDIYKQTSFRDIWNQLLNEAGVE